MSGDLGKDGSNSHMRSEQAYFCPCHDVQKKKNSITAKSLLRLIMSDR